MLDKVMIVLIMNNFGIVLQCPLLFDSYSYADIYVYVECLISV